MTTEIKTVGIAGAGGTMGAGIAIVAARAGFRAVVYDTSRDSLDAAFDPRVDARDPNWRGWRRRALKLEEILLTSWATGS